MSLRNPRTVAAFLIAVSGLGPTVASAQCPDGSPPPCRTLSVAAAPKRVNPPLDARTWIVVPFDNLAKNSEVEWLENASVNLLYLDLSRWRDIRVVDDERVADLMREVPQAGGAKSLSLNAGLAVAKRAGAGKLVMGDLLTIGGRTAITAKVYDVSNGQRLRSVREEAPQDSVMPLFGRLARRVLNVAPPQGANIGAFGTARVDAYQEYIAGVTALNQFNVSEARRRLTRALELDSTFALAHYKMSIVVGWDDGSDQRALRAHAEAAARLSTGLPARERGLINGQLRRARGLEGDACEEYGALVRQDSSDVEAWYGLGECSYHDVVVEAAGGDTTRLRFRGDWNRAIRAFQRVLELDPTYHLAYQHIVDVFTHDRRTGGCYQPDPARGCVGYSAFNLRNGDSLAMVPVRNRDTARVRAQARQFAATNSRRRNLQLAINTGQIWTQGSPNDPRARAGFGYPLMLTGRLREAAEQLAAAKGDLGLQSRIRLLVIRMELAYRIGDGAEAIRIYDSVRTARIPLPGSNPTTLGNAFAGFGGAFGRLVELDSNIVTNLRDREPQWYIRYQQAAARAALGARVDSLEALERARFDGLSALRGARVATMDIAATLMYALRAPRSRWPAIEDSTGDPKLAPAFALSKGDTAGVRAAARALDTLLSVAIASAGADSGWAMIAADAYLALNDSVSALATLRRALDGAMATTIMFPFSFNGIPPNMLYPRMMMLRADLAAAAGQESEARTWYKRFSEVWATAVPELRPMVERARKAAGAAGASGDG